MPFVPLPRIVESIAELLELRRAEREERRRERLHALWLVASGAVGSRSALARQLGRNRETVSRLAGGLCPGRARGLAAHSTARWPPPPGRHRLALGCPGSHPRAFGAAPRRARLSGVVALGAQ
ncbi:MAG: hypothetical protein JO117_09505 [Verrucomicrobia bacterium]|nr:hypothetical protein [Verrucomicrobiota bacterium]